MMIAFYKNTLGNFVRKVIRRQQLIRFGQFTTKKWFLHDSSDSYRNLFPIPREERLANPKLEQNPGYPTN